MNASVSGLKNHRTVGTGRSVLNIIHVNYSGSQGGGAAIAAMRLHEAMLKYDIHSEYWCARPDADPRTVNCQSALMSKINKFSNACLGKLLKRPVRSLNLFPTTLVEALNKSNADVVNLHWINGEMVSIAQLGRLKKPVVWTMHDMWAFCGAEHYTNSSRYKSAYVPAGFKSARDAELEGAPGLIAKYDIDRWTYQRKKRAWKKLNLHIVTPSRWLFECVCESTLMGSVPIHHIPNCIDLEQFKPLCEKAEFRREFNLPQNRRIILFGAVDPTIRRKGGDLLLEALENMPHPEKYALAIFGRNEGEQVAGIDTVYVGRIWDPEKMVRLYNAADVMCVPSRQDNLPNTCVEAHACGLPIVAFNIGGIPDIVDHERTGYLAKPFDPEDFAQGLEWVLSEPPAGINLFGNARAKAVASFPPDRVVENYRNLYEKMIAG